ncbi:MAG: cyclopropane-fatty-acyl-phospholipid synthase family protein [Pseudomonadota bacterium]
MQPLETTAGQPNLPRYFAIAFSIFQRFSVGTIDVALPDGRVFRAAGSQPGPYGRMDVAEPGFFARVVRDGELGFAEAYVDGWWSSPDLQGVMDVILLNNSEVGPNLPGAALVRTYERLRHWLRGNSRRQARKNIAHHYDLGNRFYDLWLDDTMTYSSALFRHGQESLEAGQRNKYAALCDRLGLREGDHVLEIGCGWGGFAEYAAAERGVRVTGLTLSRAQKEFAEARIARAGLSDRVEIALRDYRDEQGRYDAIASIEMFEAVGERYWPTYFEAVRERLNPGRRAALQIITISDPLFESYRKGVDFVQKYIFPGGMLPSPTALQREVGAAGLQFEDVFTFGESYSETLRRWHDTFNARWVEIGALGFDDRFRRMWNFYLVSCASCFMAGTTDVVQVTIARPG